MKNRMLKYAFLCALVMWPAGAWCAQRTAVVSGDWSSKDTWGGHVPADGDTAVIGDGLTVTVSDGRSIGASGADGTMAIDLGKTGAIVIAKGGLLRVRGDVVYTAGSTTLGVTVQGGGTWRWDASKAATPQKTSYVFRPTPGQGFRTFVLEGSATAHAVLDSDAGGAAGRFSRDTKTIGGPFKARFADITRIGDATTPGWDIFCQANGAGHAVSWDVQDCTFTSCGVIDIAGILDADGTFRHSRNVHETSLGKAVFGGLPARKPIGEKGIREIVGNVFDISAEKIAFVDDYTITGNYFGGGFFANPTSEPWAKCEGNFYRIADQLCWVVGKRFNDSVIFLDRDWDNPHVLFGNPKGTSDVYGLILSHAGTANMDSGEWIYVQPGCHHCIFLPNIYGYSSGEIAATGGGSEGKTYAFDHNTWFGGYGGPNGKSPGFAAFQYSETGNNEPGQLMSFRSNILWNPELPGKPGAFCKACDVHSMAKDQQAGPPIADVGNPNYLDYNDGWNYTKDKDIDFANKAHYHNWGKGYIGNWSKTPGEHDLDVDPKFVDYHRDVELYATKCLGKTPSRGQWNAKPDKHYTVGDTVVHTTEILWGLPVMYRYIGSGENPEPGAGTRKKGDEGGWRKSWEWASLYYIREGVRTQQRFGNEDTIMHLIKWIRTGYAPTNPALKGTAHDGTDIGAVPWQAASTTQPATAPGATH